MSAAIDSSYVCSDEGIYADINNNCEIFHICHITERADGSGADLRQYSFMCGNQTVSSLGIAFFGLAEYSDERPSLKAYEISILSNLAVSFSTDF